MTERKATRLDIYNALQAGDITIEQAAAAYTMEVKSLKGSMGKHGLRFPLILATLDKLETRAIDAHAAAAVLGCQVRNVRALLKTFKAERPIYEYAVDRAATSVKWEVHKKFAIDFIAGRISLSQAAESSDLDERSVRRVVSKLLTRHFGMVWKDLATLDINKLRSISKEIEDKEKLDEGVKRLADNIANGESTREAEGLKRVIAKRIAKKAVKKPRKD